MPDLIAQGARPQDRWRRSLPEALAEFTLGRTSDPWSVGWDDRISRQHALLKWNGQTLEVSRLPQSRNAIFYQGRQHDRFEAVVGDHFVIGQTTFTLIDQRVQFSQQDPPTAFAEQTFSAHLLRNNKYRDADRRIEALGKLPDIIGSATGDSELCRQVVNLLLQGVPQASFIAILRSLDVAGGDDLSKLHDDPPSVPTAQERSLALVEEDTKQGEADREADRQAAFRPRATRLGEIHEHFDVLHWDCRSLMGTSFTPSASLVQTATRTGESVLHIWNRAVSQSTYTQSENVDWAFCTPVVSDACPGWAIYVAGDFAASTYNDVGDESEALHDDLKFTELVSTTLGSLRQVRALQRRQDSLRNFFSPIVLEALANRDPDQVLAPRETDVAVLFCDLRGFSKTSEAAADRLLDLLTRVSDALGVMTHHILSHGGVVGDFHGDAAMGFWGWPLQSSDMIQQACLAALAIRHEFELASAQPEHPLANFRAGLGIASGPAVAGRIGTRDQVKVTVFGPVVNLAARLESMTKLLQAPILVDETTDQWIRQHVPPERCRVRKVAKVLPAGMQTPLVVSELLPAEGQGSLLSNQHIVAYEHALDAFQAGNWSEAFRLLHQVPAEDQVKDFLTFTIAQHRRVAPPDWRGVIEIPNK